MPECGTENSTMWCWLCNNKTTDYTLLRSDLAVCFRCFNDACGIPYTEIKEPEEVELKIGPDWLP